MTLQANLAKLPELCYSVHNVSGDVVMLRRGETGYYPFDAQGYRAELVAFYNARLGVTPAEREAMEIGSMMGFGVPGADPDLHTLTAKPLQAAGEDRDTYLARVIAETTDAFRASIKQKS